ncbi:MerR family transcriptional regulator [Lysinibacillus contaminans]|uniref:MerR family transcriptional regulator n=1 Tax=Lysinibacillus contaminans TaxID=1293441 RepID=A0ABR5JYV8_9BACI|nr:MerR family transcriptional regulator [Lysinibacillus contaminans]KOS67703.1 MerR family transcriptional regulator [Lysinibacillus contaminans]
MYTVKEVAALLDMTNHTVRYYTDQGLVPNLRRDDHNNRLFDEATVKWLLCVKHLRHCGMPIDDIKTYISLCQEGDSTVKERYEIMRRQQAVALTQLEEAKQRIAYIDEKVGNYFDILNGATDDKDYDKSTY